jgi:hypothetical protein
MAQVSAAIGAGGTVAGLIRQDLLAEDHELDLPVRQASAEPAAAAR